MYPADVFSWQTRVPRVSCAARNLWATSWAAPGAKSSGGPHRSSVDLQQILDGVMLVIRALVGERLKVARSFASS
eukprot:5012303-Pyramimonas_sp.AAC.1